MGEGDEGLGLLRANNMNGCELQRAVSATNKLHRAKKMETDSLSSGPKPILSTTADRDLHD